MTENPQSFEKLLFNENEFSSVSEEMKNLYFGRFVWTNHNWPPSPLLTFYCLRFSCISHLYFLDFDQKIGNNLLDTGKKAGSIVGQKKTFYYDRSLHVNVDWVKKSMQVLKNHKSWYTN